VFVCFSFSCFGADVEVGEMGLSFMDIVQGVERMVSGSEIGIESIFSGGGVCRQFKKQVCSAK
jgi:hypothetical protein